MDEVVLCPRCKSDKTDSIYLELPFTKENVDKAFKLIEKGLLTKVPSRFKCVACGNEWDNPKHLEQLLNKSIKEGKFKENKK